MAMFPDEFIGGFFQGMLNADAAAPLHDLIQDFSLKDENVLTVLAKFDARILV